MGDPLAPLQARVAVWKAVLSQDVLIAFEGHFWSTEDDLVILSWLQEITQTTLTRSTKPDPGELCSLNCWCPC